MPAPARLAENGLLNADPGNIIWKEYYQITVNLHAGHKIKLAPKNASVLAKKLPFGMMRPAQWYGACIVAGGGTLKPG